MKLDETDKKILQKLQKDSKITNKALSNGLNLSVTAVFERIKRLERNGIISSYVALVKPEKGGKSLYGLDPDKACATHKKNVIRFETEVVKLPEVLECYHVSGEYDYILKVLVKDMAAYREFMLTKLTNLEHIGSTQSTFIISPVKSTTAIEL